MDTLISEFFYDGIRRILPGLVAIGLFKHKEVLRILQSHQDSIVILACILVLAWLVGFVIEEFMDFVVNILWKFLPAKRILDKMRSCFIAKGLFEKISYSAPNKPPGNEEPRAQILVFSEKDMSRSLILIFALTLIHKPEPFLNTNWYPSIFHGYISMGILGTIIFLIFWGWASIKCKSIEETIDKRAVTSI